MKKLIVAAAFLAAAACHSSSRVSTAPTPTAMGNQTGAVDPAAAVSAFLKAAGEQDLQAMGALFGDQDGPARDAIPRDNLEKREIIFAMCLRHDRFDIVGDAPSPGGGRTMAVNVTFGNISRTSNFQVVRGPANRWYVRQFDLEKLHDICAKHA